MRLLSKNAPATQLDLLEAKLDAASQPTLAASPALPSAASESPQLAQGVSTGIEGLPLCIPIGLIDEDSNNDRRRDLTLMQNSSHAVPPADTSHSPMDTHLAAP
jgi:hypothetical protein